MPRLNTFTFCLEKFDEDSEKNLAEEMGNILRARGGFLEIYRESDFDDPWISRSGY
jgi:hypothetical protein